MTATQLLHDDFAACDHTGARRIGEGETLAAYSVGAAQQSVANPDVPRVRVATLPPVPPANVYRAPREWDAEPSWPALDVDGFPTGQWYRVDGLFALLERTAKS
ncbi:MAG: hypothetical protein GEU86_16045 [Actinophytocola sp.]|nr:hypothetical protein [Actinophytocola sp.]